MDENLRNVIATWCHENGVEIGSETDGPAELTWPRTATSNFGYITIFADRSFVDVQYGTFTDPDSREQLGMTRVPRMGIAGSLSDLKAVIDQPKQVSAWLYTPRVDIGSVRSLKFS